MASTRNQNRHPPLADASEIASEVMEQLLASQQTDKSPLAKFIEAAMEDREDGVLQSGELMLGSGN